MIPESVSWGAVGKRWRSVISTVDATAVIAACVVAVGAALRLYRLGDESLWLDEASSVMYVTERYTTSELITQLPLSDPHPPLYYLLLDGWVTVFGTSEVAVRAPSVLFSILSLPVLYLLARRLFSDTPALMATVLFAVSPAQIRYAQEARMYAILVFLALLSTYLLVDTLDGRDWPTAGLYAVVTVLLGYTHAFGLFVIGGQALFVGWRLVTGRESWSLRRWTVVYGSIGVVLSLWVSILLLRAAGVGSGTGTIGWLDAPTAGDILPVLSRSFGARPLNLPLGDGTLVVGATLLLLAAAGAVAAWRDGRRSAVALCLAIAAVPVVTSLALSLTVQPLYHPRFLLPATVGVFALAGVGIASLRRGSWMRYALAGLLVYSLVVPLAGYYGETQRTEWDDAADHIEQERAGSNALVVVTYYHDRPYAHYAGRDLPLTAARTADALPGELQAWYHEIWVIEYGDRPDIAEHFEASRGWNQTETRRYDGLRVYRFTSTNVHTVRYSRTRTQPSRHRWGRT